MEDNPEDDNSIDDLRRHATTIAEEIKDSIENENVGSKQLGGVIYYPFGSLNIDELDKI